VPEIAVQTAKTDTEILIAVAGSTGLALAGGWNEIKPVYEKLFNSEGT
jgi:hypothetical protein